MRSFKRTGRQDRCPAPWSKEVGIPRPGKIARLKKLKRMKECLTVMLFHLERGGGGGQGQSQLMQLYSF